MRGRFVYGVVALLVLAAVYACWCGTPLIWDGAYQLNWTLIRQDPYVYLTRFHTLILWKPLTLISRYTSNPTAIYMAYGLPFLLAPSVGLLVSWWILRRESPWLILWVIFGVAIGPLPGQIFVINDSIFQQHLFWPLFVSLFATLNWRQWVVLAALAIFQFAHPIGSMLFFGIAAAAATLALLDHERRFALWVRAAVALLLGAAAYWKYLHWPDPYAAQEATWLAARRCWEGGVQGYPIRGLMFMWAAGALLFAGTHLQRPKSPTRGFRRDQVLVLLAIACATVGATIWTYWASDAHRWPWASEYRRWVVPLTMPFYILCWLDYLLRMGASARGTGMNAWHGRRACVPESNTHATTSALVEIPGPSRTDPFTLERSTRIAGPAILSSLDRARPLKESIFTANKHGPGFSLYPAFAIFLGCVFVAVLGIQSTLFHGMTGRLLRDMQAWPGPIVPDEVVAWRNSTPLQHWSVTDLAIAVQGKHPRQLLASPEWIRMLYGLDGTPPVFPNYTVYPRPPAPNSNGWYDMRPIVSRLPPQPPF